MSEINLLEIQSKIQELQEAIHTAHPSMPGILREIHKKLKEDPEVVTLLEEEEICSIVSGLMIQTNVTLTSAKKPAAEKKPSAASRLKALLGDATVSADDF